MNFFPNLTMLSTEHCRELLGERAEGMPDVQVIDVRDNLYALADLLIDLYLREDAPLRHKDTSSHS